MKDSSPSVVSGMMLAGKYRVDRMLGEGGMGVVLAATNEALRQRVAIKLLRSGALANAKALGRFEREARAAASLRSEHVARVLDVGALADGRPYMVMEYLEGQDLGDVIERSGPIAVGDAVDYVLQACEAIAEAHAAGIIHRDLKPRNLFLTTTVDGRPLVKVLDFGISKIEGAAEDMSLTRTTEIIGSPSYMSPEQLRASKDVDVRTDIWAIGVILYELLTKNVPFHAATVTELVAVVLMEPVPDLRALRPDVPPELADAIARGCLAKKREERFASVSDLVRTIARYGRGGDGSTMVERVARVALGSGRLPPITGSGGYPALSSDQVPVARDTSSQSQGNGPATHPLPHHPHSGPSGIPEARGDAPPPASSARLAIHGGTSVAWGETQVDAPPARVVRRSRAPLIAAIAGLFVLLAGAATGAFVYVNRASARPAPVAATPPPNASTPLLPLPDGRKDLPPLATAAVDPAPPASVVAGAADAPTALPATRVPASDVKPRPGDPKATDTKAGTRAGPTKASSGPGAAGAAGATGTAGTPPAPAHKAPDDLSNIGRR